MLFGFKLEIEVGLFGWLFRVVELEGSWNVVGGDVESSVAPWNCGSVIVISGGGEGSLFSCDADAEKESWKIFVLK